MTLFDRLQAATYKPILSVFSETVSITPPEGVEDAPTGYAKAIFVSNAEKLNVGELEVETTSPAFDFLKSGLSGKPTQETIIERLDGSTWEINSIETHRDFYRCFVYEL